MPKKGRRKKGGRKTNDDTLTVAERKKIKRNKRNKKQQDESDSDDDLHYQSKAMETLIKDVTEVKSKSQFTVKLEDISLDFEGNVLLKESQVVLAFGHRYGLVGPNGSGKSTFMRALGKGEIGGIPDDIKVLYVDQEVAGDDTKSAVDMVIEADTERLELLAEKEELEKKKEECDKREEAEDYNEKDIEDAQEVQERLTEVYKELHVIGAHSAEHRAKLILNGLQFTKRMQACPTKELSGGWRMRIALARSLFCRPHLLLLDEPSNHLDLHACLWLEGYLKKWKKTLLVVSHDIDMLNYICTDIIELDPHLKKLHQYRGDFNQFKYAKEQRMKKYKKDYDQQQKEIKRLQKMKEQADKTGGKQKNRGKGAGKKKERGRGGRNAGGAQASRAKNIEKKQKELDKDSLLPAPPKAYSVHFEFTNPGPLPHPVLQVQHVSFKYEGTDDLLFEDVDIGVDLDSRVAIVGKNGVGKSTFMKLLNKELEPTTGEVLHAAKLKIATYSQHFEEGLPMEKSATKLLMDDYKMSAQEARRLLGRFNLSGKIQVNPISTLSGGQKARVMFCLLYLERPDILFLDEPTNHLDIESIEGLAEGLRNFKGGVVLITHNQRLIRASCDRIWCVEGDNAVTEFDGDFDDYQKMLLDSLVYYEEGDEEEG